ncbi:hypothetical protein D3C85_1639480 [compost metagenome]
MPKHMHYGQGNDFLPKPNGSLPPEHGDLTPNIIGELTSNRKGNGWPIFFRGASQIIILLKMVLKRLRL